ncbi:MAG: rhodanese-like domain-containing protein [Pseudomonadota bacterium]
MSKKILVLLGGFSLLAVLWCSGCGQSWSGKELETEKTAVNLVREVERGGYRIVPTPEMKAWVDEKRNMLIVDTMPYEASYQKNHLPGAVPFEFPIPEVKELDEATKAKFEKVLGPDKDKMLVFYCGFTKCTRSHNGAMWAVKLGYKNVYRYPGGIKAWLEAGYPVEKAPN